MLYPPVIALITLHTSINFQHTQEVQALSALLLVLYKFSPLNRKPRLGSSATTCVILPQNIAITLPPYSWVQSPTYNRPIRACLTWPTAICVYQWCNFSAYGFTHGVCTDKDIRVYLVIVRGLYDETLYWTCISQALSAMSI